MTYYRFVTRVTQRMPHMEQKRLTLPEHMVYKRFGGVRVTHLFLSFLCCVAYFLFVCFCFSFCEGIALFFVFLYLVCSMLPVSLGCSFLIALSVFSKFLLFNEIHSIGSEKLQSGHIYPLIQQKEPFMLYNMGNRQIFGSKINIGISQRF